MWSLPLHGLFRSTNLQCELTNIPRKPATDRSCSMHMCGLGKSHLYTSISWGDSCFLSSKGCFFPQLLTCLTTCWGECPVLLGNDETQERPLVRMRHREMTFYTSVYKLWKPEQTDRAPVVLHLGEHKCTQKVSQRKADSILWPSAECRNITFWTNLS